MAMQVYALPPSAQAMWPSVFNAAFAVPGASQNLLGAPVYFLLFKLFLTVGFTKHLMFRFPEHAANQATGVRK